MMKQKISKIDHSRIPLAVLMVFLMIGSLVRRVEAIPDFASQDIHQAHDHVLICDVNGDGLDDIALLDRQILYIYLHRAGKGFSKEPDHEYMHPQGKALIWPVKQPPLTQSQFLVVTGSGVLSLRLGPVGWVKSMLIDRRTILPSQVPPDEISLVPYKLATNTRPNGMMIFVPTIHGIELWSQREQQWRPTHTLDAIDRIAGLSPEGSYKETTHLDLNIGDFNADGRDDLMVKKTLHGQDKMVFNVYTQSSAGTFNVSPDGSLQVDNNPYSWFGFHDFDKNGLIDVLQGIWCKEPWFLPGTYSGKVIVNVQMSAFSENDSLRSRQQHAFRKYDWIPRVPVEDIDDDGWADLILGYGLLRAADDLRKAMSSLGIDHTLKVHFYRKNKGFPEKPDCQKDITVRLNSLTVDLTSARRDYLTKLISLKGDFNGDGMRDLLVKDQFQAASVYCFQSREKGFSRKSDFTFAVGKVKHFRTPDLNNDGVSDLLVSYVSSRHLRVYLSRKGKPQ